LREFLERHGLLYAIVATKSDKLGRGELARRVSALQKGLGARAQDVVAVSSETGAGTDSLWRLIRSAAVNHPNGRMA
jgi:GTP-binding protein EngB required for normal cell division